VRSRSRQQSITIFSSSSPRAARYPARRFLEAKHTGRVPAWLRVRVLLSVVQALGLARQARDRSWPLAVGVVLTVTGLALREDVAGIALLCPGLMLLVTALLGPVLPRSERLRRLALARELAAYTTIAQRGEFDVILARHSDAATSELRDLVAR
jgi:hypothetical protein